MRQHAVFLKLQSVDVFDENRVYNQAGNRRLAWGSFYLESLPSNTTRPASENRAVFNRSSLAMSGDAFVDVLVLSTLFF